MPNCFEMEYVARKHDVDVEDTAETNGLEDINKMGGSRQGVETR